MSERVLVVDDTRMNIDLLEGILIPAGYTVDSAESGEEALDKVSNTHLLYSNDWRLAVTEGDTT